MPGQEAVLGDIAVQVAGQVGGGDPEHAAGAQHPPGLAQPADRDRQGDVLDQVLGVDPVDAGVGEGQRLGDVELGEAAVAVDPVERPGSAGIGPVGAAEHRQVGAEALRVGGPEGRELDPGESEGQEVVPVVRHALGRRFQLLAAGHSFAEGVEFTGEAVGVVPVPAGECVPLGHLWRSVLCVGGGTAVAAAGVGAPRSWSVGQGRPTGLSRIRVRPAAAPARRSRPQPRQWRGPGGQVGRPGRHGLRGRGRCRRRCAPRRRAARECAEAARRPPLGDRPVPSARTPEVRTVPSVPIPGRPRSGRSRRVSVGGLDHIGIDLDLTVRLCKSLHSELTALLVNRRPYFPPRCVEWR